MPKNAAQFIGVLVVGGLGVLAADVASTFAGNKAGAIGIATKVAGGAAGVALGLLVLNGKGVKLAG